MLRYLNGLSTVNTSNDGADGDNASCDGGNDSNGSGDLVSFVFNLRMISPPILMSLIIDNYKEEK